MFGRLVIRGTCLTVELIVEGLSDDKNIEETIDGWLRGTGHFLVVSNHHIRVRSVAPRLERV